MENLLLSMSTQDVIKKSFLEQMNVKIAKLPTC